MTTGRVLVVGAGIAGLSTALMLAKHGVAVQIVESQQDWEIVGAGLTISGPSFRAIEALGLLPDVLAQGHVHPGIKVHDAQGQFLKTLISPSIVSAGGVALPGAGGILRSTLHRILLSHLARLGVHVEMGVRVQSLQQVPVSPDNVRVDVQLSDGRTLACEAVVLAEGLFSATRQALYPNSPGPRFTGQACWRVVLPRPAHVDHRFFYLGGAVKVGLTPVSEDQMYLFLLESIPDNPKRPAHALHRILRDLLLAFQGDLRDIGEGLHAGSNIVYRPLEAHLLQEPWHQGAVALVGDAAHATTPQLASGAGMAMEDGIVLAQELMAAPSATQAFAQFFARRFERCKMVVENSLRIGQMELARASPAEQAGVVESSLRLLALPY